MSRHSVRNTSIERLTPNLSQARLEIHQLFTIISGRSGPIETSVFERRLGWKPKWDDPCCSVTVTYADLRRSLDEIRDVVGNRRIYFGPSNFDAAPYFLGDFRVGTSFPSLGTTLYVRDDLARVEKSLAENPPECAVALPNEDLTVRFILQLFGTYTKHPVHGGFVFCGN